MEHYIRTSDGDAVMLDNEGGEIWLTISLLRSRASTILTPEQARELIAALQKVIA
jgi:hypothetical protein